MIRAGALLVLAGILVAAAAVVLARDDGDEVTEEPPQLVESADTAPPPTIAPSPAPTVAPTEAPPPEEPVPLPDRANCAEIRGTPYRSDAERALFLANCLAPVQTASTSAPIVVADISPNCTTNVQIKTNRSDKTFAVAGLTLAEINESLLEKGPVVGGVTASGVTEYGYGITGSTCTSPGSCSIGAMTIGADVVITLPVLTTLNQVSPEIKAIWDRFAERIKVHENRHATIVEEGLAEIRRLLLVVAQQPHATPWTTKSTRSGCTTASRWSSARRHSTSRTDQAWAVS